MGTSPTRSRQLILFRGTPEDTKDNAAAPLALLDHDNILWVSNEPSPIPCHAVSPGKLHTLLGRSFDCVVLDLHEDLDANVLAQSHGFIWGGGALILRLPPKGKIPSLLGDRLTVYPHSSAQIENRFYKRFEAFLKKIPTEAPPSLQPADHNVGGSEQQRECISLLTQRLQMEDLCFQVLVADRGRGKSAALGSSLKTLLADDSKKIAISGGNRGAAREVFRFAGIDPDCPTAFVDTAELLYGHNDWDIIVMDEAAQIPVPVLQKIVSRHPNAHFAFATTTHGYEGTGRGFTLRFVQWLKTLERPTYEMEMTQPIRWGENDPLEKWIFELLLLNAECDKGTSDIDMARVEHVVLERDDLANDNPRLRGFFGLLIHAHYRTTPTDLHRLLDAPNLRLHALLYEDKVVAATMVALEGELPPTLCRDLYRGQSRLRGHALPETLISHSGQAHAGEFKIIRSIRIAVPPHLRRQGLATRLIDEVHKTYKPDLFGTLFGVTEGLLQFRRSVGYEVVRLGASRGSRTGEPSAIMVRPVTTRAKDLMAHLRGVLARDLPTQLALMEAGDELHLDPALKNRLLENLPTPSLLTVEDQREAVQAFAFGPRTHEAAATSLYSYVRDRSEALHDMPETERKVIEFRILEGAGWEDVKKAVGLPSHAAAMRLLRRAVRQLVLHCDPKLEPAPISREE